MEPINKEAKRLLLKGKSVVFIDWANVYGWSRSLKRKIDTAKLFRYLKTYPEIVDVRLYFGKDVHFKSAEFLSSAEKTGYMVISKPVKYIPVTEIKGQTVYRRKCDFDMEVSIDVHRALGEDFESFIFFTGDGDYESLYKMLISLRKQVIVVYAAGHLGREVWNIKRGVFKAQLKNLVDL